MKPLHLRRTTQKAALAAVLSMTAAAPVWLAQQAAAQAVARVLDGTVMGSGASPLSGAVVYLKNTNSLAIKTYVADGSGAFHFGQLGTDADFQVWAEYGGRKSNVRTVSAFDSKKQINVALKIDTAK